MKKDIPQPARSKVVRTRIRLKHSLAADQEIHALMPDSLKEFEEALARGELNKLVAGLDDVVRDSAVEWSS